MEKGIIEKIKKLLALANSANEHEANLATTKANQLLIKHNLQLADLAVGEKNYNDKVLNVKRMSPEEKFVYSILTEFFFVEVVRSSYRGEVHILGEETNVEVALYTRDFLINSFKRLFKAYKKETKCPTGHKQSFYYGLYQGLREQLRTKKEATEQEYGLVVVKDADLSTFVHSKFNRLHHNRAKVNVRDKNAVDSGSEQGRRLNIAKGLTSNSTNSRKLIA